MGAHIRCQALGWWTWRASYAWVRLANNQEYASGLRWDANGRGTITKSGGDGSNKPVALKTRFKEKVRMKTSVLFLVVTLPALGFVLRSSGQPLKQDTNHVQWVESALKDMESIKVGMTRQEVLRVFTTEGGTSTPLKRRYVYRYCPLFKVDVHFQTRTSETGRAVESPDDLITMISKPYLERMIID